MHKLGSYRNASLWRSLKEVLGIFRGRTKDFLLIIIAIILVIILNGNNIVANYARKYAMQMIVVTYELINKPISVFHNIGSGFKEHLKVMDDNQLLREENIKLKAQLNGLNEQIVYNNSLKKLLHVVENIESNFVTAKILIKNFTPLEMNYVISAGTNEAVQLNQIALTDDGLLGRVTEVTGSKARILSIHDAKSRIPVFFKQTGCHAVLHGALNIRKGLKVQHLDCNKKLVIGDVALTSGIGGIFPHGVYVGKIAYHNNKPYVASQINQSTLDYIIIQQ